MDHENVNQFLLEVYGYGKIEDFLKNGQSIDSLDKFLEGTIMHTFARECLDTSGNKSKIDAPSISGISIQRRNNFLSRKDLSYFINNGSYLAGYDSKKIETFP